MLRIEIKHPNLIKEQIQLLHQTPLLLSALLNITLARNWLSPALDIMRLHAYLVQALPLSVSSLEATDNKLINPRAPMFAQLPGISSSVEANSIAPTATHYNDFVHSLKEKGDVRLPDVKMALSKWGHVDLLDAVFKVIDERVVSPSSIVYLVVKLRLKSPIAQTTGDQFGKAELAADEVKRRVKLNDGREEAFLKSRGDAEELDPAVAESASMLAHAPRWPGERKPSWWIVLADEKANRVVVPPLKVTDIPYARFPHAEAEEALFEHDYRAYKIQFQVPPNVGMFTWKVYVVSDTFVGEEATRNITMKIEEAPSSATDEVEDEISDPDEDTLAGQMAAMRGGAVKKRQESDDDDSDDEDSNDDSNSSSSDSD
ncbi:hypothetical protein AX15_006566 [Amanita polypyramis BW_CC]|nr:hypothetical protein AX15_006566 [Amanita polypyramis BW_CC]